MTTVNMTTADDSDNVDHDDHTAVFLVSTYNDDDEKIILNIFLGWEDALTCALKHYDNQKQAEIFGPDNTLTLPSDRHKLCELLGIRRQYAYGCEYNMVHCHPGVEAVFKGITVERHILQ